MAIVGREFLCLYSQMWQPFRDSPILATWCHGRDLDLPASKMVLVWRSQSTTSPMPWSMISWSAMNLRYATIAHNTDATLCYGKRSFDTSSVWVCLSVCMCVRVCSPQRTGRLLLVLHLFCCPQVCVVETSYQLNSSILWPYHTTKGTNTYTCWDMCVIPERGHCSQNVCLIF